MYLGISNEKMHRQEKCSTMPQGHCAEFALKYLEFTDNLIRLSDSLFQLPIIVFVTPIAHELNVS